jgi:hypothetical protein
MRRYLSVAAAVLATASLSTRTLAEPCPDLSGHWYLEYWFTASNMPNTHCHAVIALKQGIGGYTGSFATPVNPPFDGNTPCGGNGKIDTAATFTLVPQTLSTGGGVMALFEMAPPQSLVYSGFFGIANGVNYWDTIEGTWWANTNSGGQFSMARAVSCDIVKAKEPNNKACSASSSEPAQTWVRVTDTDLRDSSTAADNKPWACLPPLP